MEELKQLKEWLDITEQQYQILTIINMLNNEGIKASAANIDERYNSLFKHTINKPNLFRQIKRLVQEDLIQKVSKANYVLDIEGIKSRLKKTEGNLSNNLDEFKKASSKIEQVFKHLGEKDEAPLVRYLNTSREFFNEANKILKNSDKIYIVSPFANISFTGIISNSSSRQGYVDTLIERGFVQKKLKIIYLTQFNIYVPYKHAFNKLKDKKAAIHEVELTIKNLKNILKTQKMIEMYFLEYPFGFDFMMPVVDNDPQHVFIYTRDEHNIITGGIYIRSKEIAQRAEAHFLRECSIGLDLKTKKGIGLVDNLFRKLKKADLS